MVSLSEQRYTDQVNDRIKSCFAVFKTNPLVLNIVFQNPTLKIYKKFLA